MRIFGIRDSALSRFSISKGSIVLMASEASKRRAHRKSGMGRSSDLGSRLDKEDVIDVSRSCACKVILPAFFHSPGLPPSLNDLPFHTCPGSAMPSYHLSIIAWTLPSSAMMPDKPPSSSQNAIRRHLQDPANKTGKEI